MVDAAIKVGDVCTDLVKRGKVQVVGKTADTVEEHQQTESYDIQTYKANALLDVADDEPVFSVVYLPDEPGTSFNKTYDFPRSRLARVPVEEANDELDRVQRGLAIQILFNLYQTSGSDDMATTMEAFHDVASHSPIPADVVEVAAELADVEERFEGGDA